MLMPQSEAHYECGMMLRWTSIALTPVDAHAKFPSEDRLRLRAQAVDAQRRSGKAGGRRSQPGDSGDVIFVGLL